MLGLRERVGAAALLGAAAGVAGGLYHEQLLTIGAALLVGVAVAALVFGLLSLLARPSALRLRSMTLTLFDQELEFAVSDENRQVAWRIFVELSTRVGTQHLDAGKAGDVLDSLHAMFDCIRGELKSALPPEQSPSEGPPPRVRTVESYALELLNRELRPFLSRWRVALSDGNEASFRADLEKLRARVIGFAEAFGQLAGLALPEVDKLLEGRQTAA